MHDDDRPLVTRLVPWNKGKIVGPKPPLLPRHVWSIRTRLHLTGRSRDLVLFNLAIDSKMRGCDVVALRISDVAPAGHANDRATVRQRKTGHPVRFELTNQTRQSIDDYLRECGKKAGEFLFSGRRGKGRSLSTRQYARLRVREPANSRLLLARFYTENCRPLLRWRRG